METAAHKSVTLKKINELWLPEEIRVLLFCDKQLFQEWILAKIQNKVLIFGGMTACRKGRGTAFLDTETPTSPQLCSFSFILPHQHLLINIKPSSQLSSSPFSFLNCFYFLTSFLCNKYNQKLESFFFFNCYHGESNFLIKERRRYRRRGKSHIWKLRVSLCVFSTISN